MSHRQLIQLHKLKLWSKLHVKLRNMWHSDNMFCLQFILQPDVNRTMLNMPKPNFLQFNIKNLLIMCFWLCHLRFRNFVYSMFK